MDFPCSSCLGSCLAPQGLSRSGLWVSTCNTKTNQFGSFPGAVGAREVDHGAGWGHQVAPSLFNNQTADMESDNSDTEQTASPLRTPEKSQCWLTVFFFLWHFLEPSLGRSFGKPECWKNIGFQPVSGLKTLHDVDDHSYHTYPSLSKSIGGLSSARSSSSTHIAFLLNPASGPIRAFRCWPPVAGYPLARGSAKRQVDLGKVCWWNLSVWEAHAHSFAVCIWSNCLQVDTLIFFLFWVGRHMDYCDSILAWRLSPVGKCICLEHFDVLWLHTRSVSCWYPQYWCLVPSRS